jgi:hypothetical protein
MVSVALPGMIVHTITDTEYSTIDDKVSQGTQTYISHIRFDKRKETGTGTGTGTRHRVPGTRYRYR